MPLATDPAKREGTREPAGLETRDTPEKVPIFNVPGMVLTVLGLMLAVHLVRMVMPAETEGWFVFAMAFIPARYSDVSSLWPGGMIAAFTSPFTHMFTHGDWLHLGFNSAWLLAFGGGIAKRIGGARFLALFIFCGLAGAILFWALNVGLGAPVVGASGAIAGLMGATMRFLFTAIDDGGMWQLRNEPQTVRRMGLLEALKDRRVLLATGVFLALNVLAIFGLGAVEAPGGIAWEAHIGGFLAGLLAFQFFDVPQQVPSHLHNKPNVH